MPTLKQHEVIHALSTEKINNMAKQQKEYTLQKQVCQYISLQYPSVMFMSDTVASVSLTMPQVVRNKAVQKEGFKCPDLIIFEPKAGHHGLFLELKAESPYKKDGSLYSNEHLAGQNETIKKLINKGYYACFVWDFIMAKNIIDKYMTSNI